MTVALIVLVSLLGVGGLGLAVSAVVILRGDTLDEQPLAPGDEGWLEAEQKAGRA